MNKPDYVYVTYIATTPEKAWQAFMDPEVIRQYWFGVEAGSAPRVNESDWKVGSRWVHRRTEAGATPDIVGKVVEIDPPRRLVFTWARPEDEARVEVHSRVTIMIEPRGEKLVQLTVTHDDLAHDPKMLQGISGGWPQVLSNLKSFLETGHALIQPG